MAGARDSAGRQRRLHQSRESRERQWITLITAGVLAVVVVIIAIGVVLTVYLPPRAHVLTVGTAKFNADDIADRAAYLALAGNTEAYTNPADVAIDSLTSQEVLLQHGASRVDPVDDASVRASIATRVGLTEFTDQQYGEALGSFLRASGLDQDELEDLVRAGLIEERMREQLKNEVPESGEQFHLFAIQTNDRAKAETMVAAVRAGQDFQEAALEAGVATAEASVQDLGWFTPVAIDERLQDAIVGLQPEEISDPVPDASNIGYQVFYMEARTTDEPYEDAVRDQIATRAFQDYLDQQKAVLAPVNDLSSSERSWIIKKVQDLLASSGT